METLLILVPLLGAGIGSAAAFGATRRKRRIHFVEQNELEQELTDLDIEVSHQETCMMCGDDIEPDQIGAVVRDGDEYKVVCDKPRCVDTYDLK